jgi:hypothetical protein
LIGELLEVTTVSVLVVTVFRQLVVLAKGMRDIYLVWICVQPDVLSKRPREGESFGGVFSNFLVNFLLELN